MRWSQCLIPTQKQAPADAVSPGQALLVRAGMIHQARGGGVSFLPLGMRTLRKLAALAREALDDLGFQEVLLNGEAGSLAAYAIRSYRQLTQNFYQIRQNPSPEVTTISFHANSAARQKAADALRGAVSGLLDRLKIRTVACHIADGQGLAVLSDSAKDEVLATDPADYVATPDVAEIAAR